MTNVRTENPLAAYSLFFVGNRVVGNSTVHSIRQPLTKANTDTDLVFMSRTRNLISEDKCRNEKQQYMAK